MELSSDILKKRDSDLFNEMLLSAYKYSDSINTNRNTC